MLDDPSLLQEGLVREVVRRIQDLRKSADLSVDDTINVKYAASTGLAEAMQRHQTYILSETLSVSILQVEEVQMEHQESYAFSGEELTVGLERNK